MSPSELVMWDPNYFGPGLGAWAGGTLGEPAEPIDDFELGVTEPTADNTGFRVPEISLSNYSGDITNLPGGNPLIKELAITGRVRLPPATTATIRDSLLLGQTQAQATGTNYYDIGNHTDTVSSGAGMITYEFVEIRAMLPSYKNNGWKGGNVTLYRCKGGGLTDFLSPHGSGSQQVSKVFKAHGCFGHNFVTSVEPVENQSDLITHNDFCQCQSRLSVLEIIGCANSNTNRPRTSWLLMQKNQGGTYGIVRIEKNWMRGAEGTGSTINIPANMLASDFQEFHLKDNRISTSGKTPRCLISSSVRTGHAATISGNIEMETGSPITINNA